MKLPPIKKRERITDERELEATENLIVDMMRVSEEKNQ